MTVDREARLVLARPGGSTRDYHLDRRCRQRRGETLAQRTAIGAPFVPVLAPDRTVVLLAEDGLGRIAHRAAHVGQLQLVLAVQWFAERSLTLGLAGLAPANGARILLPGGIGRVGGAMSAREAHDRFGLTVYGRAAVARLTVLQFLLVHDQWLGVGRTDRLLRAGQTGAPWAAELLQLGVVGLGGGGRFDRVSLGQMPMEPLDTVGVRELQRTRDDLDRPVRIGVHGDRALFALIRVGLIVLVGVTEIERALQVAVRWAARRTLHALATCCEICWRERERIRATINEVRYFVARKVNSNQTFECRGGLHQHVDSDIHSTFPN